VNGHTRGRHQRCVIFFLLATMIVMYCYAVKTESIPAGLRMQEEILKFFKFFGFLSTNCARYQRGENGDCGRVHGHKGREASPERPSRVTVAAVCRHVSGAVELGCVNTPLCPALSPGGDGVVASYDSAGITPPPLPLRRPPTFSPPLSAA